MEPDVDAAEGRQLLQTDPCCALFKKTATDLTGFSGRAGTLAAALANVLQALLQAGTVKQQMIDFTNEANSVLTDDATKLFSSKCLSPALSTEIANNLIYVRNVRTALNSLNLINGLPISIIQKSYGQKIIDAFNNMKVSYASLSGKLTTAASTRKCPA
jgi:hypothetical protein